MSMCIHTYSHTHAHHTLIHLPTHAHSQTLTHTCMLTHPITHRHKTPQTPSSWLNLHKPIHATQKQAITLIVLHVRALSAQLSRKENPQASTETLFPTLLASSLRASFPSRLPQHWWLITLGTDHQYQYLYIFSSSLKSIHF